jgi:hypothetical protein
MKTIVKLSGTVTEADFREPRGILTTVHAEPVKGVHVRTMLGSAGVVVRRADISVAIPLGAILELAAQAEPSLFTTQTA